MEFYRASSSDDDVDYDERSNLVKTSLDTKIVTPEVPVMYKSYKRRFYILFLFSWYCFMQVLVWNTWGPVANTAKKVFNWDAAMLALLPNWGMIILTVSCIPFINIMLRLGPRFVTVKCSFLMALGTGLRCIPYTTLYRTVTSNICAIFAGYAGALCYSGTTVFSAIWFPPDERTKSTSILAISGNNVAVALSFLIPRFMVGDFNITSDNITLNKPSKELTVMATELDNYLYLQFGLCLGLFICLLIYYPDKPPTPPSSSADTERVDFIAGTKKILKSRNFWVLMLVYALPLSVGYAFVAEMDLILTELDISQDTSNWIGTIAAFSGVVSTFLFSAMSDGRKTLMKPLLIISMAGGTASYTIFALICVGVIPAHIAYVYASIIGGFCFVNAALPLVYEFSCELSYPVSELVVAGVMATCSGLFGCIFLGLAMIKDLGTTWMPVTMAATLLALTIMLLPMKPRYRRTAVDEFRVINSDSHVN